MLQKNDSTNILVLASSFANSPVSDRRGASQQTFSKLICLFTLKNSSNRPSCDMSQNDGPSKLGLVIVPMDGWMNEWMCTQVTCSHTNTYTPVFMHTQNHTMIHTIFNNYIHKKYTH